jgi:hypothetical protein
MKFEEAIISSNFSIDMETKSMNNFKKSLKESIKYGNLHIFQPSFFKSLTF